jgi:hypothetical protein
MKSKLNSYTCSKADRSDGGRTRMVFPIVCIISMEYKAKSPTRRGRIGRM